eukprot:1024390-Pyramimonas_sp.AAC.1
MPPPPTCRGSSPPLGPETRPPPQGQSSGTRVVFVRQVKVDRRLLLALTLTNRNGGVGVPHARDENVPVSKQPVNNQ